MGLAMEKIKLYVENAWVAPSNLFRGVGKCLGGTLKLVWGCWKMPYSNVWANCSFHLFFEF